MIYNKLGKTDLNISAIGLGTWQFNGEWGKKFTKSDVREILSVAKSLGINFVDTAECYGNHLSEELVGSFLKQGNRNSWVIATKFGHKYKDFLDVENRWLPTEVRRQLEDSLVALNTEYIDIYQFHSGSNEFFNNHELWRTLEQEKRAGKIRYLGLSISEEAVLISDTSQIYKAREFGIDVVQIRYNWIHREAEKTVIPECASLGLGIIARQPLAYGFLSGKYNAVSEFPENDVRHWLSKESIGGMINGACVLKSKLKEGTDLARWSISWCLKNKNVDSIIVGCKTPKQVRAAAQSVKIYENSY